MINAHLTGLGEPETPGKRSLFQPPVVDPSDRPIENAVTQDKSVGNEKSPSQPEKKPIKAPPARVHLTTDLTVDALKIIQSIQQEYRMKNGKVLPQWKAFSQAIEFYGKAKLKDKAA